MVLRQGALEDLAMNSAFWQDKRVFLSGHTGFKGSWLGLWLTQLGARVSGYALAPEGPSALFAHLGLESALDHCVADIRDHARLRERLVAARPDVVFHLAAQPLVRRSYQEPALTWQTNVQGTVNLLEAVRALEQPCAVVVVTTDKVYANREWLYAYREEDRLGGHDPYSASKSAAELAVAAWRSSFFGTGSAVRLASVRAGNVIGGGDWAEDRIIPDLVRALAQGQTLSLRNPHAVRPWQHVLEPLHGYLTLAQRLYQDSDPRWQGAFNFGPTSGSFRTVAELVEEALKHWPGTWASTPSTHAPHEAGLLKLAIDKAGSLLDWSPRWDFAATVAQTMRWYRAFHEGAAARALSLTQIHEYTHP